MEIRGPPELTCRGTLSSQHNSCPSIKIDSTAELASNGVEVHNFSSSGYITWSFGSHPDSANILANVLRHLIMSRKEDITKSSSFSHRSPSHDQFAALRRTSSCAVINSTVNGEAIPQVLPNSTQSTNTEQHAFGHVVTSRKEGITKSSTFSHRSPSHDHYADLRRSSTHAVLNPTIGHEPIPRHLATPRNEGISQSSFFFPSHDHFAALRRTSTYAVLNPTVKPERIPQVLSNSTQSSSVQQQSDIASNNSIKSSSWEPELSSSSSSCCDQVIHSGSSSTWQSLSSLGWWEDPSGFIEPSPSTLMLKASTAHSNLLSVDTLSDRESGYLQMDSNLSPIIYPATETGLQGMISYDDNHLQECSMAEKPVHEVSHNCYFCSSSSMLLLPACNHKSIGAGGCIVILC